MQFNKRGSHTVWDCKYHLVWTTKYRIDVLAGDIGVRCRGLLREIAMAHEMQYSCRIDQPGPYAHADLDLAEPIGVACCAILEGEKFAQAAGRVQKLAQTLLGAAFVGTGYWVSTSGNVTDEVWKEYIKNQKPPEPDDDFEVV